MFPQPFLAPKVLDRTGQSLPRCAAAAIFVLFLLCSLDCRATANNQFIQLTTYPSGGTPAKIVTADFNRDGKADVVALNSNNVLSILLGNGNGTFAAPKTIAILPSNSAGFPTLMVAADFNGDGKPDLLVVPSPGNVVKVFLGHGDGTFAAPVSIADGLPSAGDLAVGDFNGDDRPDIVLASGTSVAVLLGKSGGIFAAPVVTKTNLSAPDHLILALGDVNRDSHIDVVVTDTNGDLQVLLGTGSGAFRLMAFFSYNNNPVPPKAIAIGDFNGDGNPDIAAGMVADLSIWALGQVCILSGYGDGTFNFGQSSAQPPCYSAPDSFGEMLVTTLNGKPDLLFSSDPMIVQLNNGAGVLTQCNYAAGGVTMTLADFNGDGKQDVAAGTAGGVQVLLNAGSGVLRAPPSISRIGGAFNVSMTMNSTDFNRDGYADLGMLDFWDEHGWLIPSIDVLLGGAKNVLNISSGSGLGFASYYFDSGPPAIGDFNHDGYQDIAVGIIGDLNPFGGTQTGNYMQIYFGDGKGHFPTQGPVVDLTTNFIAAGDFNGDGNADLASLDGSAFEILIGKGDGTFAPAVTYSVGANPVFVLQRDLNGDGKKDIIVVNRDSNDVSVLLGKGDGTFLPQKTFAAGTAPVAAVTGDFNRDGKVDIAVASTKGVSVLLGNGNGTFQPQKTYSAAGPVTGIVQASLRQDGIESLIGIDSASQRFVVLPGVGNGTFGAPVVFPVDRIPTAIVAGDFNHDGATDIALLGNGSLAVFYNQGGDKVALTSSSSKPKPNQSVTFTAHVTPSYGETGTPAGMVTFKDASRILGNVYLNAGTASVTTKFSAGTHKILAQYGGNTNFNPDQSSTLTLVVGP
jgi:hypothetical protein